MAASTKPIRVPRSSAMRFNPSAMLTICVGPITSHKTFLAHESFLTTRSEFFRRAMNGKWEESATRTINLVDDDPDTFALYLNHVYKNELPTMIKSKDELSLLDSNEFAEHVSDEYMALFRLFVLAEKLQDLPAKNGAITAIFRLRFVDHPHRTPMLPPISVVRLVYNAMPRGSLGRSFVVDLWSEVPEIALQRLGPHCPKYFFLDLAVALRGRLPTSVEHLATRKGVTAYLETKMSFLSQEAISRQD